MKKLKRLKRMISLALVCLTILATIPLTTQAARLPFKDVKSGFWYTEAVTYVYEHNLMSGLTKTKFGPDDSLTRGMFVTILGRMDGVNTASYQGACFRDVPAGQWFSAYVKWASQKGIVSGYTADYFGVNDNITREQMAAIITRYLDMKGIQLNYSANRVECFDDLLSVSTWAQKSVEIMRRTGIISGNASGLFLPGNPASRAEAATVFMKLQNALLTNVRTEPIFVESNQIQSYKGKMYTVFNMNNNANMVEVSGGGYTTKLAVYEDKVYYTEDCGTGGGPTSLYRMNLDGSGKKEILTNIESTTSFCIYDDVLYYTASNWDGDYYSRSINLNTLNISSEAFFYQFGTEHVWIVSNTPYWDGHYFCSSPEYILVKELPEGSYWTDDLVTAVYDDMMYYFMKYSVMKSSFYDTYSTSLGVGPYIDDYFQRGNGMYYWESNDDIAGDRDDHLIHRLDLKTGTEKKYDLTNYMYCETEWGSMYCFWPIEEVNNKLYFKNYNDEAYSANTVCYELDLATGNIREVGRWYES